MNIYSLFKYCFLLLLGVLTISCEGPAHEEFIKADETIYVGKPDALTSSAGYRRNKLSWVLVSDPKITKAKIFWNNPIPAEDDTPIPGQRDPGRDSLVVDIERTGNHQLIEAVIDRLVEGVYSFDVYTYDADGNSSIKSEVIGDVYGDTYKSSLSNRPLNKVEYYPYLEKGVLTWFGVGQRAVVIEVAYTDVSGNQQTMQITEVVTDQSKPAEFLEVDSISDYQPGTTLKYRTGYLPAVNAIDTFYTSFSEPVEPETTLMLILTEQNVLKNTGDVLEYDTWDGDRWGIPKDWITNPQVQNIDGWGGFDGYNGGGYLSVEKWSDSHNEVENGKLYQTVTLSAGDYRFEVDFNSRNINDDGYIVVAAADTLPDVADVATAIAYEEMESNEQVEFTLTAETQVSIGFLINFFENKSNFRAHNMKLYRMEWK